MNRVFQHYNGTVEALIGAQFSTVKCITISEDSDVILIWFHDQLSNNWFRIFIDDAYCGVDCYSKDLSSEDLDEEVECKDHSPWFIRKTVSEATVKTLSATQEIVLSIKFDFGECRLICKIRDDAYCEFIYGNKLEQI